MRVIQAEKLTNEAYAPFGTFYDYANPTGYSLNGALHRFFPDRMSEAYPQTRAAFSPILVKKPERMIIDSVEYHLTTPEIILPLNDDMIIHVAPASAGALVPELTRAFVVPQYTMVKINTAVWHLAPLPVHADELQAMIILPETTYMRDCTVEEIPEEDQFEIIL